MIVKGVVVQSCIQRLYLWNRLDMGVFCQRMAFRDFKWILYVTSARDIRVHAVYSQVGSGDDPKHFLPLFFSSKFRPHSTSCTHVLRDN
jgi:hypothetical protein